MTLAFFSRYTTFSQSENTPNDFDESEDFSRIFTLLTEYRKESAERDGKKTNIHAVSARKHFIESLRRNIQISAKKEKTPLFLINNFYEYVY
jgi:hypothetical protein